MDHVSARAWSELLHAEVAYRLRQADIPVLHIKGPTIALWLYEPDERVWGDVDILVPPSRADEAHQVLLEAGFTERFPGVTSQNSRDHAVTFVHHPPDDPASAGAEVDVHVRFDGIEEEPEHAFELLWRRREPETLGHVAVWFPDLATRALLIALNTAKDAGPKPREDLSRLVATGDLEGWRDVVALAARLRALPALRAGLEVDPGGPALVEDLELGSVEISPEWALRRAGAPRTALRVEELARTPWRHRPRLVARWVVPAPAIIRMRDPAADGNNRRLAAGYLRRWRDGARSLPPTLRAMRQVRRTPRRRPR